MARGSRLSIGKPLRLGDAPHGALGDPSALGPYFTGFNILPDPEFENARDNSGGWWWRDRLGGSTTYTLPYIVPVGTCPYYLLWPDGTCADDLLVGWAQNGGPYPLPPALEAWHVTTFDSRVPQYGAISFRWSGPGISSPVELCAFSPWTPPYSCRVNPGDAVVWSGYSRVSDVFGVPSIILYLRWFNSGGGLIGISSSTLTALTITRTQYSLSASAPASAFYLRASYAFGGVGSLYTVTVVDTARLGVT